MIGVRPKTYGELYEEWKANRQDKVDNIEVTYNGIVYQGDETSQTRMDRAIRGLEKLDQLYPETAPHTQTWVAKDNSSHQLTAEDLTLIMVEAGRIQGQLWNEGRPI